ncbi:MAG: hypothetical protein GY698_02885 [Actinomycetia bacterium]|nr:hypothetical protein [Actinomycetes bacterium]
MTGSLSEAVVPTPVGSDQLWSSPVSAPIFSRPIQEFLERPLHAVLATRAHDGTLSQSVVWYAVDGETIWVSVRPTSAKATHIDADARVSILALAPHGGAYVRVEGLATRDGHVSDHERLELVSPYLGADAGAWMAENPLPSPNTRIRITPDRVVSRGV